MNTKDDLKKWLYKKLQDEDYRTGYMSVALKRGTNASLLALSDILEATGRITLYDRHKKKENNDC